MVRTEESISRLLLRTTEGINLPERSLSGLTGGSVRTLRPRLTLHNEVKERSHERRKRTTVGTYLKQCPRQSHVGRWRKQDVHSAFRIGYR